MPDSSNRDLSELEGAVLGLVHSHAPCTSYAVRKKFNESPAHHWRASAGAIYPVMERLEGRGLLVSESVLRGQQQTLHYSTTPLGLEALRGWLRYADERLVVPPDPLRTRVFFLSALAPRERLEVLEKALSLIETKLEVLEEDCRVKKTSDPDAHHAAKGALAVAFSRREWIQEMLREPAEEA